jgi:hypothetical protein
VVMQTIKTYRKVGAFYIACEEEWLLKKHSWVRTVLHRTIALSDAASCCRVCI